MKIKTIKTKSGREIKVYEATLEEIEKEHKDSLNFSYEELMASDDSNVETVNFSDLTNQLNEIWFQDWKKEELESIEKLEKLVKDKNEGK